jgi:hypothetical protein
MPTSPEDAFIRSEVTYVRNGQEKVFYLLYLEYFDKLKAEYTPFVEDPVVKVGETEYSFKDIAGLAAFIHNPDFQNQKRVYIHDLTHFQSLFEEIDWESIKQIVLKLANQSAYQLKLK